MDVYAREKYERLASGRYLPRRFVSVRMPGTQRVMETWHAERVGTLGTAVAAVTRELAATRRELRKLQLENVVLRRRLANGERSPRTSEQA